MIDIKHLTYRLKEKTILDGIDLKVEKGDFWLIFGPNGAGKTTLFKSIAGLIHQFEGDIFIDGENTRNHSKKELARKVSYLPQFEEFSLPLTVREILLAGRYPYLSFLRDYSREDFDIMEEAMREFGIAEFQDRLVNTLSGVERKKVMLASAYIQDVSIILFDEPFTFLDPGAVSNLKKQMLKLRERGKTLIVVSHNIEILFPIVDKIAAIRDGRLVYAGQKIFNPEIFKETYNIRFNHGTVNGKEIIYLDE